MRGVNDDEICDFVEMTRDRPINVRFIEYMPFDGNIWERRKMLSFREMMSAVTDTYPQGLQPLKVGPCFDGNQIEPSLSDASICLLDVIKACRLKLSFTL